MTEHIPVDLMLQVRQRARQSCEYCLLPQASQEATFHVDHIQPRATEGQTSVENLALACVTCSLKKAARTQGRDPISQAFVPLFHPRQDRWADHFRWSRGCRLIGRTPTGRATILALGMNRPAVIAIRKVLVKLGWLSLRASAVE
jgi:hypothetical protein